MCKNLNEDLKNIWSVSFVIENYKYSFYDKYFHYQSLIHSVIKNEITSLRNSLIHNKINKLPDLNEFITFIDNKSDILIKGSIRHIINATGIIINTNFGRSPLSEESIHFSEKINRGYFNLEYDIENSKRSSRQNHIENLLTFLTDSESAFVVNNNAAALFLVCNTFAKNKKVLASRGELIEIGDSFRLTDIIESSQAILKEVGTTNKTYISDYERNIDDEVKILLKSHTSNFKITGFTQDVSSKELANLAKQENLISFEDIGSGYLFNLGLEILKKEPNAKDKISDGIDLVCFSGDKILGSIQSGIIIGKKALIDKIKVNPIARTMRIDKSSLLLLENTLRTYLLKNEIIIDKIPVLKMINLSYNNLYNRLTKIIDNTKDLPLEINIIDDYSLIGGGSSPEDKILTPVLQIKHLTLKPNKIYNRLKSLNPSVIGLIKNDLLILNIRTVFEEQDIIIINSLKRLFS